MSSNITAARLLIQVEEARDLVLALDTKANAALRAANRAALRVTAARAKRGEAAKALTAARRAGKGIAAAERRVETRTAKVAELVDAGRTAKAAALAARRELRTALRRYDRISLRAATAAARTVGKIADRLGKTSLAKAPAADTILPADQIPAVEEIEARADEFAALDAEAKSKAKQADAVKKWLRQLPVGTFGRVTIARTPGGTVIDGDQVAIDYLDNGLGAPPRKGRRDTFKAIVAAAQAAPAPEVTGLAIAA